MTDGLKEVGKLERAEERTTGSETKPKTGSTATSSIGSVLDEITIAREHLDRAKDGVMQMLSSAERTELLEPGPSASPN